MQNKIRMLALGDYGCTTGFGVVMSNIMMRLQATGKYDITVVGINYDPAQKIDFDRFPGRIIPAITVADMHTMDVYGRQKFLNELGTGTYDVMFTIQDTFTIQTIIKMIDETREELVHKFATVMYYPIDATPKDEWITDCIAHIDYPVAYTEYAKAETQKIDPEIEPRVIYHGTNLDDFYYNTNRKDVATFRTNYFEGRADDKFLLTNINRNQPRKDVVRSMMILQELKKRGHKDILLYLHMAHDDAGGNLLVMANDFNLKLGEDFLLPSPKAFHVNNGLPIEVINLIYNTSDCLLSTTLGEGWGLSITEAMATKTPVVAPDNTSLHEMLADNRGYLVPSGANNSMWFNLGSGDNERMRPLTDVDKACDAIEKIKAGELPDIEGAYQWARDHSWDNICKEWLDVFEQASEYARQLNTPKQPNRQQRRAKRVKI